MPDYISLKRFARDFSVSQRTARRWVEEEDVLSEATVRQNQTLFLGSGAIEMFESLYYDDDMGF